MKQVGLFMLAASMLSFSSCDKDDDREHNPSLQGVSEQVVKTFNEMYPNAQNVEWEVKNKYAVAEFYMPVETKAKDQNHSAWFDNQDGNWAMTETDIPASSIPQAILAAFQASEYGEWRIDDIDMILRDGLELVYVIEAEQGERSVDLYYTEEGVLIKSLIDADDNFDYSDLIPQQPVGNIHEWISTHYPNARIVDIEMENRNTEVEILDGQTLREILFDSSDSWVYTKTEIRLETSQSQVPANVWQAFKASEYKDYRIDDIDFYQTPDKEYYRFDLESFQGDTKINILTDGTIEAGLPGTGGSGNEGNNSGLVDADIQSFIEKQYPGARILEKDYDRGYLEVEIWHENREKNVYFNGSGSWVYTKADYRYQELPEAVRNAVKANYPSYHVDDVEKIESPDSTYFLLELEQGEQEKQIRMDANGNEIK